jgi:hypothetical protein
LTGASGPKQYRLHIPDLAMAHRVSLVADNLIGEAAWFNPKGWFVCGQQADICL